MKKVSKDSAMKHGDLYVRRPGFLGDGKIHGPVFRVIHSGRTVNEDGTVGRFALLRATSTVTGHILEVSTHLVPEGWQPVTKEEAAVIEKQQAAERKRWIREQMMKGLYQHATA